MHIACTQIRSTSKLSSMRAIRVVRKFGLWSCQCMYAPDVFRSDTSVRRRYDNGFAAKLPADDHMRCYRTMEAAKNIISLTDSWLTMSSADFESRSQQNRVPARKMHFWTRFGGGMRLIRSRFVSQRAKTQDDDSRILRFVRRVLDILASFPGSKLYSVNLLQSTATTKNTCFSLGDIVQRIVRIND
jgi:hypothetical protein